MKSHPQAPQRKFLKPFLISPYLKCPICLEVYEDALRLYCGQSSPLHSHTFCQKCLNDFMKDGTVCPECRQRIDGKNIGVDLIAREMINQLEVFCPVEDCPWKGLVQELDDHVSKECMFSRLDGSSDGKKIKKGQKIVWHQTLDEEVLDKINQHIAKGSLEARIILKSDSLKQSFSSSREFKSTTNLTSNTEPRSKAKKTNVRDKKNKTIPDTNDKDKESRSSNYEFLASLFQ